MDSWSTEASVMPSSPDAVGGRARRQEGVRRVRAPTNSRARRYAAWLQYGYTSRCHT